MTIVYLLTNEPDATQKEIMEEHARKHEVHAIDLRENQEYERVVEEIVSSDRVISW